MKRIPQARVDVEAVDFGSELFLYDRGNDAVHVLNATARQILHLCDGEHDVEEIAVELARHFPNVPTSLVLQDVERTLDDLATKAIVVWLDAQGPTPPGPPDRGRRRAPGPRPWD